MASLATVADSMIPATRTPGAVQANVHGVQRHAEPVLTYMALTAWAAHHAVELLKQGAI